MKTLAQTWYLSLIAMFAALLMPVSLHAQDEEAEEESVEDILGDDFANELDAILAEDEPAAEDPAEGAVVEEEDAALEDELFETAGDPAEEEPVEEDATLDDLDDLDLDIDIPDAPEDDAGMGTGGMEDPGAVVTDEGAIELEPDVIPPTTDATAGVASIQANARRPREFDQEDIGLVLRSLARQAGITLVVSDRITGTVSMRLEDKTPLESIQIIAQSKGYIVDYEPDQNVYYVKTQEEKAAEPTEAAHYTFSYARAGDVLPLLQSQLKSGSVPVVDPRTNTIFYNEVKSGLQDVREFLDMLDRPTRQVMIEARLVETTANPNLEFGLDWTASFQEQRFQYGGADPGDEIGSGSVTIEGGEPVLNSFIGAMINPLDVINGDLNGLSTQNALLNGDSGTVPYNGQIAILSLPQVSTVFDLLAQDTDSELISNPRIVTADNEEAVIEILRLQPVASLQFNEQTARTVFGGFDEKTFGNVLRVLPQVNQDNFVTLTVEPEISNRVADVVFNFQGTAVTSPIIDTRRLESKVILRSGDTLAIGGLLQDEINKTYTKVPILGDLPIVGYLFQHRSNERAKRNLLIFVTPTILDDRYYTGLEDQVNGFTDRREVYADPHGWRQNAKGAIRLVPQDTRHIAADAPGPGLPYDVPSEAEAAMGMSPDYKMNARPREY